jgi:hypothetical protein
MRYGRLPVERFMSSDLLYSARRESSTVHLAVSCWRPAPATWALLCPQEMQGHARDKNQTRSVRRIEHSRIMICIPMRSAKGRKQKTQKQNFTAKPRALLIEQQHQFGSHRLSESCKRCAAITLIRTGPKNKRIITSTLAGLEPTPPKGIDF